jgi:hypothetical protein
MGHAVYYEQYAAPLRALPQPTITHDRSLVDGCYAEDAKVVSHSMRAFDGPGRAVRLADGRVSCWTRRWPRRPTWFWSSRWSTPDHSLQPVAAGCGV